MSTPEFRTLVTARGPVELAESGSGPAVLYFHGTGAAGDLVFRVEQKLVDAGFRLIVPNRPGYGRTLLEGNESVGACVDLAAELLTTLGTARVAVMGSSGGGLFAGAFASRHPERTACLVLECGQSHRWDDPKWVPVASRWTLPLLRRPWLRRALLRAYRWQMRFQTPEKFLAMEAGPWYSDCLLYTSPSPRDGLLSRMPSSA